MNDNLPKELEEALVTFSILTKQLKSLNKILDDRDCFIDEIKHLEKENEHLKIENDFLKGKLEIYESSCWHIK